MEPELFFIPTLFMFCLKTILKNKTLKRELKNLKFLQTNVEETIDFLDQQNKMRRRIAVDLINKAEVYGGCAFGGYVRDKFVDGNFNDIDLKFHPNRVYDETPSVDDFIRDCINEMDDDGNVKNIGIICARQNEEYNIQLYKSFIIYHRNPLLKIKVDVVAAAGISNLDFDVNNLCILDSKIYVHHPFDDYTFDDIIQNIHKKQFNVIHQKCTLIPARVSTLEKRIKKMEDRGWKCMNLNTCDNLKCILSEKTKRDVCGKIIDKYRNIKHNIDEMIFHSDLESKQIARSNIVDLLRLVNELSLDEYDI